MANRATGFGCVLVVVDADDAGSKEQHGHNGNRGDQKANWNSL
jgi:hypothetical protein